MSTVLLLLTIVGLMLIVLAHFGPWWWSEKGTKFSKKAKPTITNDTDILEDSPVIDIPSKSSYKVNCYKNGSAIPKKEVIKLLESEKIINAYRAEHWNINMALDRIIRDVKEYKGEQQ